MARAFGNASSLPTKGGGGFAGSFGAADALGIANADLPNYGMRPDPVNIFGLAGLLWEQIFK